MTTDSTSEGVQAHDLHAFQRDILFAIASMDGPKGLAIKADLEDYYGEQINHGRLYPNLDELSEMGLVAKGVQDRRTNSYRLTEAGRDVIRHRRAWENARLEQDADFRIAQPTEQPEPADD